MEKDSRADYFEKVADHAFDSIKLVSTAFLATFAVYFSTIAALFAFSFDGSSQSFSNEAAFISILFSAFIFFHGWLTVYYIFWLSSGYVRAVSRLPGAHSISRIKATRKRALSLGMSLAILASVFVFLIVLFVVYDIKLSENENGTDSRKDVLQE